jgi:type II secretory ATPase GspE/PulE/Tfp pilus assembly ATPase PilB-like protein
MLGEIRDGETAQIAMQAAMTGHFVFSTIHANDSVATLFRLLDLGVEPYLIASSLTSILAQRLVRILCPECKVAYQPTAEFLKKLKLDPKKVQVLYKAQGCEACQGTGYRGRTGIYEHLVMTPQIREKLRAAPSFEEMRKVARASGLATMQEDGIRKVVQGVTSIKEIIRVTKE